MLLLSEQLNAILFPSNFGQMQLALLLAYL